MPLARELCEDRRGGGRDVSVVRCRPWRCRSCELARPCIDIAEQVAVDGLQMREIEGTRDGLPREFVGAQRDERGLCGLKGRFVGNAENGFSEPRTPDRGTGQGWNTGTFPNWA